MLISSIKGITVTSQTTMPATTPRTPDATPALPLPIRPMDADTWDAAAADIEAITELKREKDAVILAHNYMTGDIFHGVADITGDSLALAREARHVTQSTIVLAGVHFMAETAKLLNPGKRVLLPDLRAGCSLAASVTAEDVSALRAAHPGVPVVTYVNTSVAVKAASDICCTSGNALRVVESLGVDRVIMIPDQYLARNIAAQTGVDMIIWPGACEVHEQFTAAEVRALCSFWRQSLSPS